MGLIDFLDIIGRDSLNWDLSIVFLFLMEWMIVGGKEIVGEGGIYLENFVGILIDL